jgi:hypothetical protein
MTTTTLDPRTDLDPAAQNSVTRIFPRPDESAATDEILALLP